MTHLSLSLLGPLQIAVDGKPAAGFDSNKVRALLVHLAVEPARPHSREVLAELLWPDLPQGAALSRLRFSLSNLRATIGDRTAQPPFLLITNETLQFNTASDFSLDTRDFWESTEPGRLPDIEKLQQAVALYRGAFMEGFTAGDSAALEEWIAFKRELTSRRMLNALRQLAEYFEGRRAYEQAEQYAWRQVELEPWLEEAHQQLMRTLALSGQRSAALAQYESCRRILDKELGVAPSAETIALYEGIRDGTWPAQLAVLPAFLRRDASPVQSEQPLFVAFESELARLDRFLDKALTGRGQVAFVTGEPGRGKTMLVQEFATRALAAHPDLIAVSGNCNAQTGVGDPYLPFLEILHMLTGDVEAQWAAGAITSERARRLWTLLPEVVPALVDEGPELLDRLVPGAALLARAQIGAPTQAVRLDELLKRRTSHSDGAAVQQTDLFEQVTKVLQALARRHPLLLVVEDLQWADAGSINLLFHIGRRLTGQRILLIGTYRPSDVALGRDGRRHPLEPVVNELQRDNGDPCLDLAQAEGRHFVEALVNSQPNRLGAAFRATLYQHTHGHPLFTVELLRGMQARGDLVQDAAGQWMEGASTNWESLPPRVEAVIAERIGRLPAPLQATLAAASVQGEEFTVEAVARVQSEQASEVIRRLSGPLSKQHRLVSAAGVERLDEGHLSHYRFRHSLYQKYLYGGLDEVERAHMHEAMGNALETLYGERSRDIAAQLARHFEAAGLPAKAVGYLLAAGNRAVQLSANQEAIAHYRHGLNLLATLPDSPQRAQQELALQMSLGVPLAGKGYADPEMGQAYGRAWELCQQLGPGPELFPILTGLGGFYSLRAEFETARAVYEEILAVAQRSADPTLLTIGHWGMGYLSVVIGELVAGRGHLEQALSFYDPERHRTLAAIYYHDPGASCLVWLSWALWALGYPDQAVQRSREALALAEALSHPLTQGFALALSGTLRYFRREPAEALPLAEAAIAVSSQYGFPFWRAGGVITRGWALAQQNQDETNLAAVGDAVAFVRASGARQPLPTWLMTWAAACAALGRPQEGLRLMDEAQVVMADRVGSVDEADQHRFRGDLMLQAGAVEGAEACFQQAIELARRQQAKSWELRATLSLCRLWQSQGRHDEARQRLAAVVGWFTEGFDTPDLAEAAELLRELAGPLPRPTSPL